MQLPRDITPKAPPLKTQGIKTKLLPMIGSSVKWDGSGRWVEPFLGSACVPLNIAPDRALLSDTNKHIITLYTSIQAGVMDAKSVRDYLELEGARLSEKGEEHYYEIRARFNETGSPFDFLFINRSCFNGVMRFNRKGGFNVPFCRKPERFQPALITKIVNQVNWAAGIIRNRDWEFRVAPWNETVAEAVEGDLIYCDPPYIGRNVDYFNGFTEEEADDLARAVLASPADFAFSMWLENKYRRNDYVDRWFSEMPQVTTEHFYHVGSTESLRNAMTEVLVLSPGAVVPQRTSDAGVERSVA